MEPGGAAVLITGAGSGIGAASAHAFARQGAPVLLGDVDGGAAESVAQAIVESGGHALAKAMDVRKQASVQRFVATGVESLGSYRVVCANAGIGFPEALLAETSDDVIDQLVNVNLRGVIHTLRSAIPHVVDGGAIVVTSSTSGFGGGDPGAAVYAATKTALVGLVRSLAIELSSQRIRVNAVCPGTVDTPLLRRLTSRAELDRVAAKNPLGRLATVDDVAQAIVFLASSAAGYINGVALRVDGGEAVQFP